VLPKPNAAEVAPAKIPPPEPALNVKDRCTNLEGSVKSTLSKLLLTVIKSSKFCKAFSP
jgi:hypothetical protein